MPTSIGPDDPPVLLPGTAARLANRPTTAPEGAWILADEGAPAEDVKRGDWIAVDRQWRQVTLCVVVNLATEIRTDPATDLPTLPSSQRVHVARLISCEAIAVASMLGYGGYAKAPQDRGSKL